MVCRQAPRVIRRTGNIKACVSCTRRSGSLQRRAAPRSRARRRQGRAWQLSAPAASGDPATPRSACNSAPPPGSAKNTLPSDAAPPGGVVATGLNVTAHGALPPAGTRTRSGADQGPPAGCTAGRKRHGTPVGFPMVSGSVCGVRTGVANASTPAAGTAATPAPLSARRQSGAPSTRQRACRAAELSTLDVLTVILHTITRLANEIRPCNMS